MSLYAKSVERDRQQRLSRAREQKAALTASVAEARNESEDDRYVAINKNWDTIMKAAVQARDSEAGTSSGAGTEDALSVVPETQDHFRSRSVDLFEDDDGAGVYIDEASWSGEEDGVVEEGRADIAATAHLNRTLIWRLRRQKRLLVANSELMRQRRLQHRRLHINVAVTRARLRTMSQTLKRLRSAAAADIATTPANP
jgi:hypothetical protein